MKAPSEDWARGKCDVASFLLIAPRCCVLQYLVSYSIGCPPIETFSSFHLGIVLFVLFYHDVMPTLDCRDCKECVGDHLLFIHVFVSSFSGQRVSVPVHVCSTSPGKEVRGSLCQGVAKLCGP